MPGLDGDALARNLRELTDHLSADVQVAPLSGQLGAVVSAATELLGVDSVGLLLLDDTDRIRSVAATGHAAAVLERAQEKTYVGPGVDVLAGCDVVAVTDLAGEPRYRALWEELAGHGVRAVLAAPICVGGQVVGNLNAVVPYPRVWTAGERQSAEALAGIVGQLLGLAAQRGTPVGERDGREPAR